MEVRGAVLAQGRVAALLGCPVLVGGGALKNAGRLQPGETVALVGMGGVGQAAVLVACALGAGDIMAVDSSPALLEASLQLGATSAQVHAEALAACQAFDVVVDCAGNRRSFTTAVQLTRPGGRTIAAVLPRHRARVEISPLDLVAGSRRIIGSYQGSGAPAADIALYAQMYLDGALPLEKLISETIRLADINHAMDQLRTRRSARPIIDFLKEAA